MSDYDDVDDLDAIGALDPDLSELDEDDLDEADLDEALGEVEEDDELADLGLDKLDLTAPGLPAELDDELDGRGGNDEEPDVDVDVDVEGEGGKDDGDDAGRGHEDGDLGDGTVVGPGSGDATALVEDDEELLDDLEVVQPPLGRDLDVDDEVREGEFVCRSCFMAKRESALADVDEMLCRDCV